MAKILLIYPPVILSKTERPTITAPLGVAYVAAVCEEAGFDVKIIDCLAEGEWKSTPVDGDLLYWGLTYDEIEKRIKKERPDVVGISCQFSLQYIPSKEIVRMVKRLFPQTITVMGGTHPTIMYKEILANEGALDYVVLSEGEYTFTELVKSLSEGRDVSHIDGLAYREDGRVVCKPKRGFIEDLDALPFPARHLLPMDIYAKAKRGWGTTRRSPKANMITSRGCPFKCTFCGIWINAGKGFRARSPENVIAEIEHLTKEYGIQEIHFEDDNLTLNRERAERIFDLMIERGLDVAWAAPSGLAIWTFNDRLLEKMVRSGCYRVNLGLESGNDHVLRNVIKKPLTRRIIREKIGLVKKYGLEITGFWVIGNPGETVEQMWDTLDFARELGLEDNQVAIALPYPGTELYETCKKKGYLAFDQKDEKAYEYFSIHSALIRTEDFSPEDVIAIRDAGRFIALVKREGIGAIPYRTLELFRRNGLTLGFKVLYEAMKKSIRLLVSGLTRKSVYERGTPKPVKN